MPNWDNVAVFFMTDEQKRKIRDYDSMRREVYRLREENRDLANIARMGRNRPPSTIFTR